MGALLQCLELSRSMETDAMLGHRQATSYFVPHFQIIGKTIDVGTETTTATKAETEAAQIIINLNEVLWSYSATGSFWEMETGK